MGELRRCVKMPHHKTIMLPVLSLLMAALACAAPAGEVSWIAGTAGPLRWSVQPIEPNEIDTIRFSGPAGLYKSQSVAEQGLGKPVLQIDIVGRKIQLRFDPVARSHPDVTRLFPRQGFATRFMPPAPRRADTSQPVCGLQGSFGPLAPGLWQFLCTQAGIAVTLPFEVRGQATSGGTTYYVDARATGAHDGSNWTDAFALLQDALVLAGPATEIRVAQGVYRPDQGTGLRTGDILAAFVLKSGVVLKGGYAGLKTTDPDERDVATYESVLSGDLLGNDDPSLGPRGLAGHPSRSDNSLHVVVIMGTDSSAALDGFTITGGNAFAGQQTGVSSYGGGVYIQAASPVIRHCLIVGNAAADFGGGIYVRGQSAATLTDCVIADNWSGGLGGGAFVNWDGGVCLERCLISGNAAFLYGGGISCYANGSLLMSNSVVSGNVAGTSSSGRGGGLHCSQSTAALNHCTFLGNAAAVGAGIACNSVDGMGKSEVSVANSILWDPCSISNMDGSALQVAYSDVSGGWPGQGNLNIEPGFLAAGRWDPSQNPSNPEDDTWSDGDYRLMWESPCVDAGDPCAVADAPQTDFAGLARFSGLRVDMGAYELKNDPPTADAGPEATGFVLKGDKGTVVLDAGRSSDPEGRPLSYAWYREGQLVSEQKQFTVDLPLGEHAFTLIVNDGTFDSAPDEVLARVSRPVATQTMVTPVQLRRRTGSPIVTLTALPKGKRAADFDTAQPVLLLPGNVRAVAQSAFRWLYGQVYIMARFNRADLMAAVPNNGPLQVTVIGRLKDGTYFAGTDSVNVK
jgi:hypothetical protein